MRDRQVRSRDTYSDSSPAADSGGDDRSQRRPVETVLLWRTALAIPYSAVIALASAKSGCVRPPAACVESVIRRWR
jgi:hypothetical protein